MPLLPSLNNYQNQEEIASVVANITREDTAGTT
jgi:hypothetical protein